MKTICLIYSNNVVFCRNKAPPERGRELVTLLLYMAIVAVEIERPREGDENGKLIRYRSVNLCRNKKPPERGRVQSYRAFSQTQIYHVEIKRPRKGDEKSPASGMSTFIS